MTRNKKYCGHCITCCHAKGLLVERLSTKYRNLFRENRCIITETKIKRDRRQKDNIKVI